LFTIISNNSIVVIVVVIELINNNWLVHYTFKDQDRQGN
jgi:hypothetical protein